MNRSRSKSRDDICLSDDDFAQRRKEPDDRPTKSEVFPQHSAREVPKFVLIVEDFSTLDTETVINGTIEGDNPPSLAETEEDLNGSKARSLTKSNYLL